MTFLWALRYKLCYHYTCGGRDVPTIHRLCMCFVAPDASQLLIMLLDAAAADDAAAAAAVLDAHHAEDATFFIFFFFLCEFYCCSAVYTKFL